ncbi:hypothetical protein GCM10020219_079590 [Nonomuraea dietziae]
MVFIDEVHTLVGAGSGEGGMWTRPNILKPALSRGELHVVAATTIDEYRKHIEKDAALERRFQPVLVPEPSVEDTVGILAGLRDAYEAPPTRSASPTTPSTRPRACRPATSPTASCPTRPST